MWDVMIATIYKNSNTQWNLHNLKKLSHHHKYELEEKKNISSFSEIE